MTTLSPDQELAMQAIKTWFQYPHDQDFRMGGLAGTGKTTITATVPERLALGPAGENGGGVYFCAPTGKAAKVLSKKLPHPHTATTVHRLLYRPNEVHCEECPHTKDENAKCHGQSKKCGCTIQFQRIDPEEQPIPSLIVVDEASMVNEVMYQDLMDLGTKVLFVGDHGQLPPVEGNLNLMAEHDLNFKLEKIHRQAEGSSILEVAYKARHHQRLRNYGPYGDGSVHYAKRSTVSIDWGEDPLTQMICYSNAERTRINRMVRRAFGYPDETPIVGDRVICLRNNQEKGVVNGSVGTIIELIPQGDIYEVKIELAGEDHTYEGNILAEQFNEKTTLWAPREVDLWTYAYCLTCHKAQGSEADDVIVIMESFHPNMSNDDRYRWLYTAFTRAKKTLTIIDWRA